MKITLYGIHNCDTVKKARKWLDAHGIEHHFVDLRQCDQLKQLIPHWLLVLGDAELVNRRSTTWRQLNDSEKHVKNATEWASLLQQYPTLIKRPVTECLSGQTREVFVGFKPEQYQARFDAQP